jgi:2-C-methyl-D-erythritol 4-phosphate cytidylyltransferase
MWRAVVLPWPELPESLRSALHVTVHDVVAAAQGDGIVVVDERCPGLDAATLRRLIDAARDGRPHLGVRPVTDTVKRLQGGVVTGTVDRAGLLQLASPLVVPETYGRVLGDGMSLEETARRLADLTDVVRVEVPAAARRAVDRDDLRTLLG